MTEYYVFTRHREDVWAQVGPDVVQARSAKGAIQEALKTRKMDDEHDTFVAVPARSWKPVTVKVETKTALKFS